jgi:hypothetical protein
MLEILLRIRFTGCYKVLSLRQALTREPRANPNYDPNKSLNAGLRGGVYQKSSLLFWIWCEYRTLA